MFAIVFIAASLRGLRW